MPTLTFNQSLSGAGLEVSRNTSRSADGLIAHGGSSSPITLPVGKAGSLTTRTDDNTGEATLGSGHGITTGMIVDVYFSGGVRHGMTVGTVSGNVVPLDGGAGAVLPAEDADIVVSPQVPINVFIDGDNLKILGAIAKNPANLSSTDKAKIDFRDSGNAAIGNWTIEHNTPRIMDVEGGNTNTLTGNPVTKLFCSNGSTASAATLEILGTQDTTP